ncbi:MAG TPA: electron transport complex subunit RsxC, partial [Fibrobacteraceae bacterium]|nr:electron transport complex subunit RsxC [Fibrobacteraceae bacterium]
MMRTFSHGIHPDASKGQTQNRPIRRFPFAPYFVVHLSQNAGTPARSIVQAGQEVRRGQVIARPDGHVSVPVHAPVTGTVQLVGSSYDSNGNPAPSIIIRPNPSSDQAIEVSSPIDPEKLNPAQLIQAIRDMGMVGLGGAAFPTHVKLSPPKGKSIHTLIFNGAECEPYLTSDHRVMVEQAVNVVMGAKLLLRATGASKALLGVENNKPDAIAALEAACMGISNLQVVAMPTKYPQGAEKMLLKTLLGVEIPSGGLPADVGVAVSNIATVAEIGHLLPLGMGLLERVVTITGDGIRNPGNYLIPIGTPLDFILKTLGTNGTPYKVIFGGPMMGKTVSFLSSPITKGTSGIVVLAHHGDPEELRISPCIRCGKCVEACPMHLVPARLGWMARKGEYELMATQHHLLDCFECGCCSYVCPSNIPLVQQFRISKQMFREK